MHIQNRKGSSIVARTPVTAASVASLLTCAPVRAQSAAEPAAQPGNDAIVQMRNETRAADQEYDRKVAPPGQVFNQKMAQARIERSKAIAAARAGAG
jgi:hypothetical protein